jgi:hypothetical protein
MGDNQETIQVRANGDGTVDVALGVVTDTCTAPVESCSISATCYGTDDEGNLLLTFFPAWDFTEDGFEGFNTTGLARGASTEIPSRCNANYIARVSGAYPNGPATLKSAMGTAA